MRRKRCPRCGQEPEDYGTQTYCRPCWRTYQRTWKGARRPVPKAIRDKIAELKYFIDNVPALREECTVELGTILTRYPRGAHE